MRKVDIRVASLKILGAGFNLSTDKGFQGKINHLFNNESVEFKLAGEASGYKAEIKTEVNLNTKTFSKPNTSVGYKSFSSGYNSETGEYSVKLSKDNAFGVGFGAEAGVEAEAKFKMNTTYIPNPLIFNFSKSTTIPSGEKVVPNPTK